MTIHAGEKAARLRRAAATSSIAATSTTTTPVYGVQVSNERPLSSIRSLTDADVLGLPPSSVIPTSASLPSFRSQMSSTTSKHQRRSTSRSDNVRKFAQSASSNHLQAITGHFIFPGVDPAPPPSSEVPSLDWDNFDVRHPASIESPSYPPSLVFVQKPERESLGSTSPRQDMTNTTPETQPSSITNKASPRRMFPWLFLMSPSASSPAECQVKSKEGVKGSNSDHATSTSASASGGEDVKKPAKKKKKKKKGKGNSGCESKERAVNFDKGLQGEERMQKGDDSRLTLGTIEIEGEVEALTLSSGSSGCALEKQSSTFEKTLTVRVETQEQKDTVMPDLPYEADVVASFDADNKSGESLLLSSCLDSSDSFKFTLTKRKGKSAQRRKLKESQRRDIEDKEQPASDLKTQTPVSLLEAGHARNASKSETETSFHTAFYEDSIAPAVASFDESLQKFHEEDCKVVTIQRIADTVQKLLPLVPSGCDHAMGLDGNISKASTRSTLTEDNSLSTGDAKESSRSSPVLEVQSSSNSIKVKASEITWEQNKEVCQLPREDSISVLDDEAVHSLICTEISPLPSHQDEVCTNSDAKQQNDTDTEQLERHKRTLDWRLSSAGSSSPVPNLSSQVEEPVMQEVEESPKLSVRIPSPRISLSRRDSQQSALSAISSTSRTQLALHLRRHQQKRLRYAWVHLLPSFEDVHPRRSEDREATLRRFSWLGLEEYAARRVRTLTNDGSAETVVWITHSCFARGATPYRSKASQLEPLLYPSSLWLRSTNRTGTEYTTSGARKSEDTLRIYRAKLLQERRHDSGPKNLEPLPLNPIVQEELIHNHQLDWPSSPPILDPYCYHPVLFDVPLQSPLPSQAVTIKQVRPLTSSAQTNIDRESSLELQRVIEDSIYELRFSDNQTGTKHAWLQSLNSIGQDEKAAIEDFFHISITEWNAPGCETEREAGVVFSQPVQLEPWQHPELMWPTTPYTPLGLALEGELNKEEEETFVDNGLSSFEMAEIEDAMFRDYLLRTNQGGLARISRRAKNNSQYTQARAASQGDRPRVSSSGRRAPAAFVGKMKNHHSLSPVQIRSQDEHSEEPSQSASEASLQRRTKSLHRSDLVSPTQGNSVPFSTKGDGKELVACDRAEPSRAVLHDSHPVFSTDPRRDESPVDAPTIANPKHQAEQNLFESWAKETENRAVRHSLANLQQHLSLVAAQKQIRSVMCNKEVLRSDRVTVDSTQHTLQGTNTRTTIQRDNQSWPSSQADFLPTSKTAAIQAQRVQHAEKLRQEWLSLEARQLEQRHLDSYAQAMDRSSSLSSQAYVTSNEDQSRDVARIRAALASEWVRHGGIEGNPDWLNVERLQLGLSTMRPPTITLTEPTPATKAQNLTTQGNSAYPRVAWSDEPIPLFDEALSHQAQCSWQAAFTQMAGSHLGQRRLWNSKVDTMPSNNGELGVRRSSVQLSGGKAGDNDGNMYLGERAGAPTTSAFRRCSLGSSKQKRGQHYSASKRKEKHKEGALQKAIESIQMQPFQQHYLLNRAPLTTANEYERKLLERQQQQQQHLPSFQHHALNAQSLVRSYDDELLLCNTSPILSNMNPTLSNSRKQGGQVIDKGEDITSRASQIL